jgi:hypothetical protein
MAEISLGCLGLISNKTYDDSKSGRFPAIAASYQTYTVENSVLQIDSRKNAQASPWVKMTVKMTRKSNSSRFPHR